MNLDFLKKTAVFCTVVICLNSLSAGAQTVRIYSAQDSTTLIAAHCYIKSEGDTKAQISLSDQDGKVDLSTANKTFPLSIQINAMGFLGLKDTIFDQKDKIYYLKPDSKIIQDVVITGQYAPSSASKSVHVIKVINSEQIQKMAAQNLKDVLSNSLNIRMNQDNILGSGMSIQGISGQNVKILKDGVPLIGRLNGNIDLSQINMNNVERIEIVEGPLSVNYGTDALAGTINIITKKNQNHAYNISNENYYESNGQYNISGKIGYKKKNNTLQLSLGRNYFDGWNEGDKPFLYKKEMYADNGRTQAWKPKEQIFGYLSYGLKIKDLNLYFSSELFDENILNRGTPRAPYGESALDDRYKTLRTSNTLGLNGKLNEKYQTNILFSYNYYKRIKNSFYNDLTSLNQQLTSGFGDQDTTQFSTFMSRASISSTLDGKINYEVGYDINYETTKGLQIKDHQKDMGDYAIFSTAEYVPLNNFTIKPGLRAVYNTQYKAPLIPSVNLKYFIPLSENRTSENLTLRASYARGFRAPSLKEMYFNFVDINHDIQGNENLKAESSHNFIFNIAYQQIKNKSSITLEWNNFYNKIQNLMVLAQVSPTSATYSYANIGHYITYGTSLNAEIKSNHLSFSIGGSYIALYNQLHETDDRADQFSFTPEIRSSLIYEWRQPQLSFAVFYKYSGKTPGYVLAADESVQQNTLGDYQMADVSVSKSFLNGKIKLAVGSKNIFNVTNILGSVNSGAHSGNSYSSPLSMGRTYFFSTNINLNYN